MTALRRVLPFVIALALLGPGAESEDAVTPPKKPQAAGTPASPGRLHIISSSHQDIAWMDSPEKCIIYRDANVITPALAMMAKDPAYSFTMENMLNLAEYLERHPDRKEEIGRLTREGRMEWGATYNQPYESLLSGEQLIRQTYFGRRWLKRTFPGADAKVYFNPDVPGRAAQMPQILAKAGIPYLVMSRYHEGFYRWASPDGSSVLAYSPGHYGNAAAYLNAPPAEGAKTIADKVAKWAAYYATRGLPREYPLLNSVDFSQPTDFGPLIRHWNGDAAAPGGGQKVMQYSSARKFFEAIDVKSAKLETVTGERPGLWLYIHGPTHHWAISAQRRAGFVLPAAETFSTIRALVSGGFERYPSERLNAAWEAAIYPDHGWGGKEGQITDRLFRKKYEFASAEAQEILSGALASIAHRFKSRPPAELSNPLVVFNPLSWARTDPVLGRVLDGPFRIVDDGGKEVAYQFVSAPGSDAPGGRRVEFVAKDVPALGYKTFYIDYEDYAAKNGAIPLGTGGDIGGDIIENAFYRIELAPGGVKSIFDKELGREVLETEKFLGFEVFTMRSVGSGAGEFGRVQQPTMEGFDRLSKQTPRPPMWMFNRAESGPVKIVYTLSRQLKNCRVTEKLTVWNDIKRIDCEADILGWDGDPYREFRLAVPVAAEKGQVAYEIPLGVLEVGTGEAKGTGGPAYGNLVYDEELKDIRPREVQNFLYAGDDRFGVTLTTSVAVNDYKDPTDDPVAYPVLQPILLASRRSCHGEGNWYLQEGDHHFRFSLTTHPAGWRNGYKRGIQSNSPLIGINALKTAEDASLPESMSFLSLSAPNVLVSTLKKAEDGDAVILRVFDIEGRDAEAALKLFVPLKGAEKVNIIEEEGTPLKAGKDGLSLKVGHHAVETVKLVPDWKKR